MKKNDEFIRVRNLSILRVLKGTGLRESELAGLNINKLYLDEEIPYIKVIRKGTYREIEEEIVYLTGDATNGTFFFTDCGHNMYSIRENMAYHGCLCPGCLYKGIQTTLYIRGSKEANK